jgi:hypothetical protein
LKVPKKELKMAKNEAIRIRPVVLQADLDAQIALQAISDYKPANAAYAKTVADAKLTAMRAAQTAEVNAMNALATARDAAAAAEWEFHNIMLGVKTQVMAQYGDSSDQMQALGLKKKSERKKPAARKAKAA